MNDIHSTFRFHDVTHARDLSDVLEMHYIELVKCKNESDSLRTPFERWVHVLKFGELYGRNLETLPQALMEEDGIKMAIDKMRYASSSEEVRQLIWDREQAQMDYNWRLKNRLEEAKEALREQGLQQGLQQGLHEGLQQGLQQGRDEERMRVARTMLENGIDAATVEKCTGLRQEDLT